MDQYENNYNHQVTQVDEILTLHKENEGLYEKCKVDHREMKRDVLANRLINSEKLLNHWKRKSKIRA